MLLYKDLCDNYSFKNIKQSIRPEQINLDGATITINFIKPKRTRYSCI